MPFRDLPERPTETTPRKPDPDEVPVGLRSSTEISGLDYASDDDPLGYMTASYDSPYLVESELDMERRFLLGRHASEPWQRALLLVLRGVAVLTLLMIVAGVIAGLLLIGDAEPPIP